MSTYNLSIKINAGVNGQAEVRALEQALAQLKSTGAGVKVNDPTVGIADNAKKAESAIGGLMLKFGGLASAVAAVVGPVAALKKGLDVNSEVENATLGIASLVSAMTDVKDSQGTTVTGAEALSGAIEISKTQMDKLRVAGIQTSATFTQLVAAYQQAIGAGSSAGLNLDEILDLTVSITQAAGALGMPMEQLNQEVRSILSGQITADSNVGKALGLKNEELKLWREQGVLADKLNEKLQAFTIAGGAQAQTLTAMLSNMADAVELFLSKATGGAFDGLKEGLSEALKGAFDIGISGVTINEKLQGIADFAKRIFDAIGDALEGAIKRGAEGLNDISNWLSTNRPAIDSLLSSVGSTFGQVSGLARDLLGLVEAVTSKLVNWNSEGGTFVKLLDGTTVMVAGIRDLFGLIAVGLKALGATIIDYVVGPITKVVSLANKALNTAGWTKEAQALGALEVSLRGMLDTSSEMTSEAHEWVKAFVNGGSNVAKAQKEIQDRINSQASKKQGYADEQRTAKELAMVREANKNTEKSLKDSLDRQLISKEDYNRKVAALRDAELAAEIRHQESLFAVADDADKKKIRDQVEQLEYQRRGGGNGYTSNPKTQQTEAEIKAQKDMLLAQAEAALKITKQQLENEEAELTASYERKAIKAEEYYAKLAELQKRAADAEIANLKSKQELETDPAKLAKLEGDIQALELSKEKIATDNTAKLAKEKGKETESWAKKSARELKDLEAAARSAGQAVSTAQNTFDGDPMKERGAKGYWFYKDQQQEIVDQASQPAKDQQPGAFATASTEVQQLGQAVAAATAPVVQFGSTLGNALAQPNDRLPEVITEVGQLTTALNDAATAAANTARAVGSISLGSVPGAAVPGFAEGGAVTGPGTGTSDSIMAWLSNGEFVIPADVVRRWGVSHFEAYRQSAPRFATGGLVGGVQSDIQQSMASGASSGRPIAITVQNEISDDVFSDWAGSGSADKIFRNQIGKNARYIKQIVGA